jgi:ionotropic glutamate receptor
VFGHWQRLLELTETGIIDYWEILFRPMPGKCKANFQTGYNALPTDNQQHKPLTLKNLTGAFLVLLVGSSLSLLTFLCEKIISMWTEHQQRQSNKKFRQEIQ